MMHISERKFRAIVKCFAKDCIATVTASLTDISRPSINRIFSLLQRRIAEASIASAKEIGEFEVDESYFGASIASAKEIGEFEVDESYFGARLVRGKRGRGAAGKTHSAF